MGKRYDGFCECGCGERTSVAPRTDARRDRVRGRPMRFVLGHHLRLRPYDREYLDQFGYRLVLTRDHPRGDARGYVREHILVAERALGRTLPPRAVVHHINGDKADNRPENLVICQDNGYHHVLHARQRALEACGHPAWLKCWVCGKYGDPKGMLVKPARNAAVHRPCITSYNRTNRAAHVETL